MGSCNQTWMVERIPGGEKSEMTKAAPPLPPKPVKKKESRKVSAPIAARLPSPNGKEAVGNPRRLGRAIADVNLADDAEACGVDQEWPAPTQDKLGRVAFPSQAHCAASRNRGGIRASQPTGDIFAITTLGLVDDTKQPSQDGMPAPVGLLHQDTRNHQWRHRR